MNWLLYLFCAFMLSFFCQSYAFTIYWNVPTHLCINQNVSFTKLLDDLHIEQNADGKFSGEKFTILYSPGLWPSMEHNTTNGGMPQHGNLSIHLEKLKIDIKKRIKEENYTGLAVIDMESWRPIFCQNTGWMIKYRYLTFEEVNKTLADEFQKNPKNTTLRNHLMKEGAKIFEPKAKEFLTKSTELVKKERSKAKWGYYGFPYCFNMGQAKSARNENCPDIVQKENNKTDWLFKSYDYWFPSVYISSVNFTADERLQLVRGRTTEYNRLRDLFNQNAKIYPYVWYLYNLENKYLNETDLRMTLKTLKDNKMDGTCDLGFQ
uniref:Hyaluronidase n=1 Tax=Bichromomyia olmeca TaxID=715919 RepID=A0A1B1V3I7_9DIPT|nr:LolHyaz [Bichromomyia olmeca]